RPARQGAHDRREARRARGRVRLPDLEARRLPAVHGEPRHPRRGLDHQRRRPALLRDARVHDHPDRARLREPADQDAAQFPDQDGRMTMTTAPDATATAPGTDLAPLQPPAPVAAVEKEQAPQLVQLDPQTASGLDAKAEKFAGELGSLDIHSAEFQTKLKAIYDLGSQDIRDAASVSNRLLDKPTKAMESGVFDKTSDVSTSLVQLRRTVEDLDPSRQGLFTEKKLFGLIPFGNRLRDYFAKYQSGQSHLNAIIDALLRGQDELQQDNASIEQEKTGLWQTMANLRQYVYLAQKLDSALSGKVATLQASDPEKAKTLQEDGLFYVRQKVQDLLTQLAVSAQGYMALDMI